MSVVRVKAGVWGDIPVLGEMRVWPLIWWNIRNINIYIKNIYKKHIDNKHQMSSQTGTRWITPEQLSSRCSRSVPLSPFTGTSCKATSLEGSSGFRKKAVPECSGSAFQDATTLKAM